MVLNSFCDFLCWLQVPVGKDYRLSAAAVKKHITKNTVLIVASAPGFPHGVIDHIEELGKARPSPHAHHSFLLTNTKLNHHLYCALATVEGQLPVHGIEHHLLLAAE